MSARRKLNVAFFNGSLVAAAVVGLLFRSWTLFVLTFAALLIGNLILGEIRPTKRKYGCSIGCRNVLQLGIQARSVRVLSLSWTGRGRFGACDSRCQPGRSMLLL